MVTYLHPSIDKWLAEADILLDQSPTDNPNSPTIINTTSDQCPTVAPETETP